MKKVARKRPKKKTGARKPPTGPVTIRAHSNGTNIFIAWRLAAKIPNCIGFALKRKSTPQSDADAVVLVNHIGFADSPDPINEPPASSLQNPFQRCTWNDWTAPDQVSLQYQVIAVYADGSGPPIASAWSDPVEIGVNSQTGPLQSYFNDGVIATQWIARELTQPNVTAASLMKQVQTPGSVLRARLGGTALPKLRDLLTTTLQSGGHVYAALYELNDPELMGFLTQLKHRAHIVLANGAGEKHGNTFNVDENHASRAALKAAGVDVHDRILPASGHSLPHFGHNKFAVFTDKNLKPQTVWTGSVNWTFTGLCTQVNNAVLIADARIAQTYLGQWNKLAAAGNKWPPYPPLSAIPKAVSVGGASVTVAFTPFTGTKGTITKTTPADLAFATSLIAKAQQGVLFFFFNPGPRGTLLDAVSALQTKPNFYIRGVVNQDPNPQDPGIPDPSNPHVLLMHRNQNVELPEEAVMPSSVNEAHSYWLKEELRLGNVLVHSKLVVIDPFGTNPVVITGSHNDGTKASLENDENLVIVQGDAELAAAYAVNVITVFNQYWWRYNRFASANKKKGTAAAAPTVWPGLVHNDSWQTRFLPDGAEAYEVNFWT